MYSYNFWTVEDCQNNLQDSQESHQHYQNRHQDGQDGNQYGQNILKDGQDTQQDRQNTQQYGQDSQQDSQNSHILVRIVSWMLRMVTRIARIFNKINKNCQKDGQNGY